MMQGYEDGTISRSVDQKESRLGKFVVIFHVITRRMSIYYQSKRQDVPKEALPRRSNYTVKALAGGWVLTNCMFRH